VTSDQRSTCPASLPALCGHPHHCAAIPGAAASCPALWEPRTTGHRHACRCAASGPPSAQPPSRRTDGDQTRSSHAATLEVAPRQAQDSPRRPPEARFARTTINFMALCAMPSYVVLRAVRHDCKPPPWPIKGGGGPPVARGRQIAVRSHFSALIHDIGTLPQSNLSDMKASPPLLFCL
jgi:hypothetical protein